MPPSIISTHSVRPGGGSQASSTNTIESGDGFVEFKAGATNAARIAGLSTDDASQAFADVDFGVYLRADGTWEVVEAGVTKATPGAYDANDRFRVEARGGAVKYLRGWTEISCQQRALVRGLPAALPADELSPVSNTTGILIVERKREGSTRLGVIPNEQGDRIVTSYSIWGVKLDIDRLLAAGRPSANHEVWRRGDPSGLDTPAVSAGLTIQVFCGNSQEALQDAVMLFLKREARFLRAARARARSVDHSGLTTYISVGSGEQSVCLELSASLLALVAKAGVTWTFDASVFPGNGPQGEGKEPRSR